MALLMAAARDDRGAVAILSSSLDARQAREVAVFCAYIAAQQFGASDDDHCRPGLYETALREVALRMASPNRDDPPG